MCVLLYRLFTEHQIVIWLFHPFVKPVLDFPFNSTFFLHDLEFQLFSFFVSETFFACAFPLPGIFDVENAWACRFVYLSDFNTGRFDYLCFLLRNSQIIQNYLLLLPLTDPISMTDRYFFHPVVLPSLRYQWLNCVSLFFIHKNSGTFYTKRWLSIRVFFELGEGVCPFILLPFPSPFSLHFFFMQLFEFFFGLFTENLSWWLV